MKDERKHHGTVNEPSSEQHLFCDEKQIVFFFYVNTEVQLFLPGSSTMSKVTLLTGLDP